MTLSKPARSVVIAATCLFFLSCLALSGCGSQGPAAKLRDPSKRSLEQITGEQALSIDDVLGQEGASEFRISPDGATIAWVKDGAELFMTDFASGQSTPVAVEGSVSGVQWSPDGSRLSFVTDAPPPGAAEGGAPQVWVMDSATRAVAPVSQAQQGVTGTAWSASNAILYTASDGGPNKDPEDDTYEVTDYSDTPIRLFKVDLGSGATTRLTSNDDRLISISGSPDGKYAFYTRTRCAKDVYVWQWQQKIPFNNYLLDLGTGKEKQVFSKSRMLAGGGLWSPDAKTLYVIDNYSTADIFCTWLTIPRTLDVASGQEAEPDLGWAKGLDQMSSFTYGGLVPVTGGFITLLANGTNPIVARYTGSGSTWKREDLTGEQQGNVFTLDAAKDGTRICYSYGTANIPAQLYAADLEAKSITDPKAFTDLNPDLKNKDLGRAEVISWTGARGDVVEGILQYPSGYQPGKRYPLVFMIHGGPAVAIRDQFGDSFEESPHLMAQKGAFVLLPNYHGSLNYGLDFQTSLTNGNYYKYPLADFDAAIDRLDDLGMIDPNRLGTLGWSNGSILGVALIARGDKRFKAASCGAGGGEWISDWGGSWFGGALIGEYWFKDPVKNPDFYTNPDNAPFYNSEKVVTPTIFYGCDKDRNVPLAMTWNTFRGIEQYGKVPVKMFVFPDETHYMALPVHMARKIEEDYRWFEKYLFGTGQ